MRRRTAIHLAGIVGLLLALPLAAAAQDVCDRTPQVRDKLIESAGVSACEEVTPAHLSKVTVLDFKVMKIAELQAHDFSGLSNLESLDLSQNSLSSLPEGVFDGLGSLQTLNLWGNVLTGLREGVFEDLSSLKLLQLGYNDLSNLGEELFDGLGNLQELLLGGNDLTGLPEEIFDGLGNLERLDLWSNNLASLPEGTFEGLGSLKRLSLSGNDLTGIPVGIFQDLDSLQSLGLVGAFASVVGSTVTSLPEKLFDGLSNLEYLYMGSNFMHNLPAGIFKGLAKLEFLSLDNSFFLTSLPEGIFEGLGSLKYLRIHSYEFLEDLSGGIFEGLDSLQYLHLAKVSLNSLPAGIFDDVLDTLGGVFSVDGRTYRGRLSLNFDESTQSELSFASTSQTVPEGETARVAATLSTALPVAIRVPYTVGGTATTDVYTDLSPSPSAGLLFPAGETRREITLTLKENSGNRGETIVLTLAERSEIKLRPSDGTGPDAPHLDAGVLLNRFPSPSAHTISVGAASAQGVCNRSPQVRDRLMEATQAQTCGEVTAERLARVRGLSLSELNIAGLQENDFDGLSQLTGLSLTQARLVRLPERVFSRLGSLEFLSLRAVTLSGLPLTGLPAGIFGGLGNLKELDLSENNLTALPAGIFQGLGNLHHLNLASNPLTSLPKGIFDDPLHTLGGTYVLARQNPRQGALYIPGGLGARLSFASASQTAFQADAVEATAVLSRALPVAVRVPYSLGGTATANDFTDLSPSPTDGLLFRAGETRKAITFTLTIKENAESRGETVVLTLGERSEIRLRRSDGTGPDALHLKGNILIERFYMGRSHTVTVSTSAEDGVCNRTQQVRDALMEAAGVSTCEQVSAQTLSRMSELNLANSGITELQAHDFSGLDNLQELTLWSNQLTALPQEIFKGLDRLQSLSLGGNPLTSLTRGVFEGLGNLQELNLGSNELTILPQGIFEGLASLRNLYLGYNTLTALPVGIFGGLGSLTVLNLEGNALTNLTRGTFDGLASLQSLNLVYNSLTGLGEEVFDGLSNLESLFLDGNSLTSLPERIFEGLENLQELMLQTNKLASLPEEVFGGLSNLRILALSPNALTSLPAGIFNGLGSLEFLELTSSSLISLPAGIFDELHSLKFLGMVLNPEDLSRLPKGIFDEVLDTVGAPYFWDGVYRPGYLWVTIQRGTLSFVSAGQAALQGETVKVAVTLSQALPLAVRVPYRVGGTATADAYTDLSPSPTDGLLFRAGETSQEITLTLLKDAANQGQTVTLALGTLSEIGLRRSDGSGPDAPHLKTEALFHPYYGIPIHTLTLSGSGTGKPVPEKALFVPVLLTSAGLNNAFFTSELTLTNRGSQSARLDYTYTAHVGGGSGSGTASDRLAPGRQKIEPDAIDYLTGLGIPIPGSGNRIGTLRVEVSGSSEVSVVTRTTTAVPDGRAGLAYPGIAENEGFQEAVYLCGLRQNRQDRSNVAFQNMGAPDEGSITLRTTVFSGEADDTTPRDLGEVKLQPGGFHQYSGLLDRLGSPAQGFVKVEKVEGEAPFYAYGVINDNFNSDGSFVFPLTESSLVGRSGQTLPVIIETGSFQSELTVTNFSAWDRQVDFSFVADAVDTGDDTATFSLKLKAGEQSILPDIVEELRRQEVAGIGPAGRAFVGALFATAAEGDMSGIVIGARTGSPDQRGGQYSLFYNAVPYGSASIESAWIYGLQQNEENRSNLALVNTGEIDDSSITLDITIYDGSGDRQPRTRSVTLGPRRWTQENGILGKFSQGYVQVTKTSGNNPFVTYGVINDGGKPGERSGDGAFLFSQE